MYSAKNIHITKWDMINHFSEAEFDKRAIMQFSYLEVDATIEKIFQEKI